MSCYTPLYGIRNIWITSDGVREKNIKIVGSKKPCADTLVDNQEIVTVPCGKCIGCRLDYSREWADRCVLEAKQWTDNCFVTLTYDNDNLPIGDNGIPSLNPDDLTKFMKDLRRYYSYHYGEDNIRFYACGEYGDKYHRPHYHVLLFNCKVRDLEYWYSSKSGYPQFTSDILEKIWNKGIVSVGSFTWETAAYTARYVMKKQKGNGKRIYSDLGIESEFVRMSRNPGISRAYYEDNKSQIYRFDEIFVPHTGEVHKAKPSKYYDRLFDIDSHFALERIKARRKLHAENVLKLKLQQTSLSEDELRDIEFSAKKEQLKALKRHNDWKF